MTERPVVSPHPRTLPGPPWFTAGEAGRFLKLTPKQIHLRVDCGELVALRTPGGHLRIARTAIVRALRRSGHPIPPEVSEPLGHSLVVTADESHPFPATFTRMERIAEAALALAGGEYEAAVFDARLHRAQLPELIGALRRFPMTRPIPVVALGSHSAPEFLAAGGDQTVETWGEALLAIDFWLGRDPQSALPEAPSILPESGER